MLHACTVARNRDGLAGRQGPHTCLQAKLCGWGSTWLGHIEPWASAEYKRCFCTPAALHTGCENDQASAGIALQYDSEGGECAGQWHGDTLALRAGVQCVVHPLFKSLGLWPAQCSRKVIGQLIAAEHFHPDGTTR